ncbi:NBR1-Ig-like domain-containing protein [Nonomuraea insulae]|uniref:NBR1-Ig-like domain-containing protein n=1 Tax=Nonomuraea insulae TaxID=1616787 RepID=A0ABW1CT87_9ACTN
MAESPETQDDGTGARRGRKPIRPDPESGPVALFAHRLWELKEQAGDPSFADMASRLGAAASKSSLAAAARGSALPSWETTWEFVRVLAVERLGRDPEEVRVEWRAYWEQAGNIAPAAGSATYAQNEAGNTAYAQDAAGNAALVQGAAGNAAHAEDAAGNAAHAGDATGHAAHVKDADGNAAHVKDATGHAAHAKDATGHAAHAESQAGNAAYAKNGASIPLADDRPSSRRRRLAVLTALTGVVGVGAILLGWVLPFLTGDAKTTPTPTPTAVSHDDSVFERDVTYPDGTVVKGGTSFDKTWRIRNAGNVPWQGRYLTRMNDTPCKAPKRVGIGPVLPGESVDITVRVRAAESPGRCKIFWKMTDEDGSPLLASKKPIFLDITVA